MEVGDDGRGLSAEKTAEGLGMKLVKNIVEVQLNGSIELSSEGGVLVRIEFDESDCAPG
jgi:two-component sensor histidine kinase